MLMYSIKIEIDRGNQGEIEDVLSHLGISRESLRLAALSEEGKGTYLLRGVQKKGKNSLETVAMHCTAVDDTDSLESISNKAPQCFTVPAFGSAAYSHGGTVLARVGIARSPAWT